MEIFYTILIVVWNHLTNTVANANVFGPSGSRSQKYFRRRGMRILVEEMMLNLTGVVKAQPISQFHLVECIVKQLPFAIGTPGARQLQLVKYSKLRGGHLFCSMNDAGTGRYR